MSAVEVETPGRFCGRWSDGCRDVAGMPAGSAPLADWVAWYRSCGCELCVAVADDLEDRPVTGRSVVVSSW